MQSVNKAGSLIISGSIDETIKIWRFKSKNLRNTLRGNEETVINVEFSEN